MFRDRQANNKEPMIMLHNVDYDNLKALIEYMYKGEANVPQHMLSSFIRTAEMLQIRGLAEGASPPGGGGGGGSSNNNKSFDNSPHHSRSGGGGGGIMPGGSPSHHMPVRASFDDSKFRRTYVRILFKKVDKLRLECNLICQITN